MFLTLIGPRGAGKTTLGRKLADRVGVSFTDLDTVIEWKEGRSVPDIFAHGGEAEFRILEREAFEEMHCRDATILATGGGVIFHPETQIELGITGKTILLLADPIVLAERIRGSERPSLTGLDAASEIGQVLAERREIYEKCAARTIDTTILSIEEAVDVLEHIWKSLSGDQFR
ncbi:MAG: shikimate kinase [bacterium]